MTKVFISYRREDSSHQADRIREALTRHLPKGDVFIDNMSASDGFGSRGGQSPQRGVLLALIGPAWIAEVHRPADRVRGEISVALQRGIEVIPVLLDGALIPQEHQLPDDLKTLVRLKAVEIRRDNFEVDTRRLVEQLGVHKTELPWRIVLPAAAGVVVVVAIAMFVLGGRSLPNIAGRWDGWAESGIGRLNYTWFITQQADKVTGTIKLKEKDTTASDYGTYEFEGRFDGKELTFAGTRVLVADRAFCMARGALSLAGGETLDGEWGPYPDIPGGCADGLEGRVHLQRQ